jgi:hypothetical protein
VDDLRSPPAPGWKLQCRRAGGFTANGKHWRYGATIDDMGVLDGANVGKLFAMGMLAWVSPAEAGAASAPLTLSPPVYAKANPKVTIIEVFGDPVSSWRRSVAATAATLEDGSPARAYDLLLGDARGYAIYQKANAQNYQDQVRAKGRPGGPIRPL